MASTDYSLVPVDYQPDFGTDEGNSISGPVNLTSQMAPNGFDYSDWRRSTNVIDRTQDPWYEPYPEHAEQNFKDLVHPSKASATLQQAVSTEPVDDDPFK